jgi:hypothetical protein
MNLSATTPTAVAPAPRLGFPVPDDGTPSAPNAVARVKVTFPMNFMATAAQDVLLGAVLGHKDKLEDARFAARQLAVGRTSLGVVAAKAGGFDIAELDVFNNDQMGPDPKQDALMPLAFGPDPARTRIVESIHLLKDPGSRPVLQGLWIRGGNTYIEFDANGDGNVSFNHA